MSQNSVAKIVFLGSVFLFILLAALGLDFALTVALILSVVLFSLPAWILLISAGLSFALNYIFLHFSFAPSYISDPLICSYLFFASWAVLFAFPKIKLPAKKQLEKTGFWDAFLKTAGVIIISLLLLPLIGGYGIFTLGYSALILLLNKIQDSRLTFWPAFGLLALCPLTTFLKLPNLTETLAILAFLLLMVGISQELISAIWAPSIKSRVIHPDFERL